ncbi:helicase C-terminal domain-containing protein [Sporomusa sphaeroides]|uniref:helicase C-terminal domain-containing protein n=1 Tax=Sporomusa sphaeroides TaxID=47679 RepID=UPI002BD9BD03|nr:DEAD/DEAH box helicase family protein [Sporomusa sphaeroides]HML34998.1 helicase C-terminal domain-containing protein [Sporomusa sphaeroides]
MIDNELFNKVSKNYEEFLLSFNSPRFTMLREAQKYILQQYSATYARQPNVAIELPTGAGKSLISLLIGEAWRQAGKKVAILTANKTLARQMFRESESLGIPAVLMEGRGTEIPSRDKRAYHRSNRIAIMNYWVYYNQNPVLDPADLLIMDDAHLAEHCLHSLYSVEINKQLHESLFESIISEMARLFPEYHIFHDALDEDAPATTPPELLSFIDQISYTTRLRELGDSFAGLETTDRDFKFSWNRIRTSLQEANIYIGLQSIWIRPYIYPLEENSQWTDTTQRLYMSATIGNPSDLGRRLGTRNVQKIPLPPGLAEATNGRRLIVMNRIEDADIPRRLQGAIYKALEIHPKSIWLCSSKAEAAAFRNAVSAWLNGRGMTGHPTWILTSLGDEIEQFKAAECGHLFVAGRFDGMDFAAGECRLVVLATLPRAINLQEEFICAYLRDSAFMSRRLNQRVVQALGRCNREEDDYGIYVLADRRFATHFGRESSRNGISKNIVAEIDMAEDATEIAEVELARKIETFMQGDFTHYDAEFTEYLRDAPSLAREAQDEDISNDEILAWTALFHNKNYPVAAQYFERCYMFAQQKGIVELGAYYGWCWAKATYLNGLQGNEVDLSRGLELFEQAISRGGQSSWFNRMRSSLNRARRTTTDITHLGENNATAILQQFDEVLESLGGRGNRFQRWVDRNRSRLESQSHNEFQEGLEELGRLLGYRASRPRHGAATDCRWRGIFGNVKEVITFEAKIEHNIQGDITPAMVGQAHNQLQRAIGEFGNQGYVVRGTIVTHLASIDAAADSSAGNVRIIPKEAILALWEKIIALLIRYRQSWSLDNINQRRIAAGEIRPSLPPDRWLATALDENVRWIDAELLLQQWR